MAKIPKNGQQEGTPMANGEDKTKEAAAPVMSATKTMGGAIKKATMTLDQAKDRVYIEFAGYDDPKDGMAVWMSVEKAISRCANDMVAGTAEDIIPKARI